MAGIQVYSGKKHKPNLLLTIGIIVGVIVIAAGAGLGLSLWQQRAYDYTTQTVPKEVTDAQNLVASGDFDKAHETVNNALKDPNLSTQSKYDLLMQQAFTYEGQKKPDAAMEAYRQADAVMQTMDTAQCIARLAADKGDKEMAIAYYQKALTLIPNDSPMRDENKKYFESMISVLQGGEPKYD